MAAGQGNVEIDFGAYPGRSEAEVIVTGIPAITAASNAEAYLMGDSTTADHTASDHRYAAALIGFTVGSVVAGTGFTIYARCLDKLQGKFLLNYVWAD